jgi:Glucose/sorbosone dehydrogenases
VWVKCAWLIDPVWHWNPSIAPSGLAFYNKDMFPEFNGNLLVGSLKFKKLYLVYLKDNIPIKEKSVLKENIGRIRDIEVLDDGSIIILTDEENGGVFRLFN